MFTAIDIEATGLSFKHGCSPFMVAACNELGDTRIWSWNVNPTTRTTSPPEKTISSIQSYIDSYDTIVFHNALYDIEGLQSIGITVPWSAVQDTMLLGHLYDSGLKLGLKDLALVLLHFPDDDETALGAAVNTCRRAAKKLGWCIAEPGHPHFAGMSWAGTKKWKMDMWLPAQLAALTPPVLTPTAISEYQNLCATYCLGDVNRTAALYSGFLNHLSPELWSLYEEQLRCLRVIYRMQQDGVSMTDDDTLIALRTKLINSSRSYKQTAERISGIDNVASAAQLQDYLYTDLKLSVIKRTKHGHPSTDKDTLNTLCASSKGNIRKFFISLLTYKKLEKTLSALNSYVEGSLNRILYPSFNPTGTRTTRLSSSNPNGQNVGKGGMEQTTDEKAGTPPEVIENLSDTSLSMRSVFGPLPHRVWWALDASQLQLRIFAYETGEEDLIQAFLDGWDAHDYMAHRIYSLPESESPSTKQRTIAKNTNFGYIFGATPRKIEQTAGRKGLYTQLKQMFPQADKFMSQTKAQVHDYGCVHTHNGYPLTCYEDHAGVNYVVQGDEGIIIKRALIDIDTYLQAHLPAAFITLQVHDEIIIDAPLKSHSRHLDACIDLMTKAGLILDMVTPVTARIITTNWSEGTPYVRN